MTLTASTARGLAALGLAALACAGGGEESSADRARRTGFRGFALETPVRKPDFTLTDTEGRPFDFRAETDGYVTLLFFGYTHCPDVCPVHMANLAAVLGDLSWRDRSRIKVVFVTTDPERDTPRRLREWLDAFDPHFIGLTGDADEVYRIQDALGLPRSFRRPGAGDDYVVEHASQLIAFSADGVARSLYPFGTRQVDWAHDLPLLLETGVGDATRPEGG